MNRAQLRKNIFVSCIWTLLALFVAGCAIGFYLFEEYTPRRIRAMAGQADFQAASAIVKASQERLRLRPSVTEGSSCGPLPASINRSTLVFWGFDDDATSVVPYQRSAPSSYTNEQRFQIWQWASEYVSAARQAPTISKHVPLSAELKERLASARTHILNITELPCAYEWRAVQGVIVSHAEQLILSDCGEVDPLNEYDGGLKAASIYQQLNRIPASRAEKESVLSLALQMIDHATSLVFARSIRIRAGMAPGYLEAFRKLCMPFGVSYAANESAAILWNRGRFLASVHDSLTEDALKAHQDAFAMMREADNGRADVLMRTVRQRLMEAGPAYTKMAEGTPKNIICEYPPGSGDFGTEQARSINVDDVNDPIVNFVQKALSDQSKIAFGIQ